MSGYQQQVPGTDMWEEVTADIEVAFLPEEIK